MLTRLDKFVIALAAIIVVPGIILPAMTEGPKFARCTQAALDVLKHADPLDRKPPAFVTRAIEVEQKKSSHFWVVRLVTWPTECNGPPSEDWGHRVEDLALSWWIELRFQRKDLVALYAAQAYLGHQVHGFSRAAHFYYGRGLDTLTEEEVRCLMRKERAPSAYNCNGR